MRGPKLDSLDKPRIHKWCDELKKELFHPLPVETELTLDLPDLPSVHPSWLYSDTLEKAPRRPGAEDLAKGSRMCVCVLGTDLNMFVLLSSYTTQEAKIFRT